jgi:hypothetical protein
MSLIAGDPDHPFLLEKRWFPQTNASNLRAHLRCLILELFNQQNPGHPAQEEAEFEINQYRRDRPCLK